MAIIYSYPTVTPSLNDLVLGTDVDNTGKATRNFTVQSIIDLVTVTGNNLQDVLNNGNSAVGRDIILGTVQDPAQTIYANTFSTGVASIVGGGIVLGLGDCSASGGPSVMRSIKRCSPVTGQSALRLLGSSLNSAPPRPSGRGGVVFRSGRDGSDRGDGPSPRHQAGLQTSDNNQIRREIIRVSKIPC